MAGRIRGMQLSDVVDTARTVAATSSRTAKVEALAACP
jgi:DNA ligase 1